MVRGLPLSIRLCYPLSHTPHASEEVQDHCEDIDVACDLSKVGGLPPVLVTLRDSPHPSLRALAASLVATVVQNNPKAQSALLDAGALQAVLHSARHDADVGVRSKALLAISCLVRGCPPAVTAFRLGDGFGALRAALAEESLQKRALFLALHFAGMSDPDLKVMVELGFVRGATVALASQERACREASLRFLLELARNVDFEAEPKALTDLRHPLLEERLRGREAALAGEGEGEAGEEERQLVGDMLAMLRPAASV